MKKAIALTLGLSIGSAFAAPVPVPVAKGYGGIQIHSSVPKEHEEGLKSDIRYVFNSKHKNIDQNFLAVSGLTEVTGPILHNWLINRVRYVVGERFDLEQNAEGYRGFKYPKTLSPSTGGSNQQATVVVMSNLGGALYMFGKGQDLLMRLNLDGDRIFINSPRAGILQIGEGLFHPKAQLNNDLHSSANSIQRIGTLFHEARHSDGNGKSLSFAHEMCPEDHPLAFNFACEKVANGPYSVGAYSTRQFLANCSDCSELDKTLLQLRIVDSLGRILYPDNKAKIDAMNKAIQSHQGIIENYSKKLAAAKTKSEKDTIAFEIEQHRNVIANYRTLVQRLEKDSKTAPVADAKPEGPVRDVPVATSKAIMERSLKAGK